MIDRPRLIAPLVTVMVSLGVFVSTCGAPGRAGTTQAGSATGTLVISAQFELVMDFQEGLAAVYVKDEATGEGGRWGFIDRDGKMVIRPQFDGTEGFSEGLAVVRLRVGDSVRFGFIDKTGRFAINPDFGGDRFLTNPDYGDSHIPGLTHLTHYAYGTVRSFRDGLASVPVLVVPRSDSPGRPSQRATLDGYIDKRGKIVIEPRFSFGGPFVEGLAVVALRERSGDLRWGYIDRSGQFAIEPRFDRAENFSEGLAEVAIGDGDFAKWGYINRSGRFVITPFLEDEQRGPSFDRPSRPFSSGLAAARYGDKSEDPGTGVRRKIYGKWGFISRTGDWAIPPRFQMQMGGWHPQTFEGRFIDGLAYFHSKDGFGYIDSSGKWAIPPQFADADEFSEGLAAVKRKIVGHRAAWGYIDRHGRNVVPFRFAYARRFSEGRAPVCVGEDPVNCLWGFIGR